MKTVTTPNRRYYDQQNELNEIAKKLGVVAFRPDYHGKDRDKNTVLFYLEDDARYNAELDKSGGYITNDMYRKQFFSFENTDVNGFESYEFANRGRIDLRGLHWKEVLEGHIRLAYISKMQNGYASSCGGYSGIREADDYYNDLNREQIKAFLLAHKKAFIGKINMERTGKEIPVLSENECGQNVCNFGCDFVVPCEDEVLKDLIEGWNGKENQENSVTDLNEITARIEKLGGIQFIWY